MTVTTPWRTVIVDDEPLGREGIRTRLRALGGFEIVGECGSGRSAVTAIRAQSPDVVFLDVQMPVVDGFGVIDEVGVDAMPAVVFVTAHDHYALRAFDAQAIDYVLKPIDDARFARTIASVRRRLGESRDSGVTQRLLRLLDQVHRPNAEPPTAPSTAGHLVARDGARIERVPFTEIDWVAADGDYVRVHAGKRHLLLRLTMNHLERALPAREHVRIHRSAIVNVNRIRTIEPLSNGDRRVVLANGVVLRASRSYASRLRGAVGSMPSASALDPRSGA